MAWALAHGQVGRSGGMLTRKIWKFRHVSNTFFWTTFNTAYNENHHDKYNIHK